MTGFESNGSGRVETVSDGQRHVERDYGKSESTYGCDLNKK